MTSSRLVEIAAALSRDVGRLRFAAPVTHVYDPLQYAWRSHQRYLERYGRGRKHTVFLGMNPGPFGMAQTGVPFGEIDAVRTWLGIEEPVDRPRREHPKRPVLGFACARSEVSGKRVWGWAKARWGTPARFFRHHFVANYCPLVFMAESGANLTPDKLPRGESAPLFAACDRALRDTVAALAAGTVVAVGAFAEARAHAALGDAALRVVRIPHPSPASPLANRGWAEAVEAALLEQGVELAGA